MRQKWIKDNKKAPSNPQRGRSINDFTGNILNFGGTVDEYRRLERSHKTRQRQTKVDFRKNIFTVNNRLVSEADIIASMDSISAMKCLPSNRFDVVYFSGVPGISINLTNAFRTAFRVLKEDGIMLFTGHIGLLESKKKETRLMKKNPYIKVSNLKSKHSKKTRKAKRKEKIIDIPRLLSTAGFKHTHFPQVVLFKNGQTALGKQNGEAILATKSTGAIDLKGMYEKAPELKDILEDCMYLGSADRLADSMQDYDDEPTTLSL